ncbi:cullin 3 [Syncephalis fuscata]|nr:cullin 3 [Syncephalis fuscata]
MNASSSALPGNKRLKARINPPRRPTHSADLYGEMWPKIEQAIKQIYNINSSRLSFEELYRASYTLVIHKKGSDLYQDVGNSLKKHLEQVTAENIVTAFPANRDNLDDCGRFLNNLADFWDRHTRSMVMIRDILMYMDRVFVKASGLQPVYETGMDIFRDVILRSKSHPVQAQLLNVMLTMIERERQENGSSEDQSESTVYHIDFEKEFLKVSREYYNIQAQSLLAIGDVVDYLNKTERWLNEEASRSERYLTEMTGQKIREVIEQEMMSSHLETIIEMERTGMRFMLTNEKMQELNCMYRLLGLVEHGHASMRKTLSNYIQVCGKISTNNDSTDKKEQKRPSAKEKSAALAIRWVELVLALHSKFNRILAEAFSGDKVFQISVNEAFSTFINNNKLAVEYISLFIDENLQRGIKGKVEQEIDSILDNTVSLFRYIEDKDMFERYYKHHLSRRLLQSKSVSDDAERGMIAKLRIECGVQFTSKLEGMFNDIKLSSDIMRNFKDDQSEREDKDSIGEINVQVLTSTYWPITQTSDQCVLPLSLRQAQERFTSFYLAQYSGRKLMFQMNMGTVEVRAYFNEKRHDLIIPTYALAILMLFEQTDDWITYDQLLAETGIPEEDLQRNLFALTSPKHPILRKDPSVKESPLAQSGHRICFNTGFKSKLMRIRIVPATPRLEQASERKATMGRVMEERQIQTDACIVRVMKSRPLMTRFRPDPSVIKRRIESLIEREYLERAPDDLKTYHYLA